MMHAYEARHLAWLQNLCLGDIMPKFFKELFVGFHFGSYELITLKLHIMSHD